MPRLKIAVISKANAPGGGASRVAEELAHALNEAGHEATHFCCRIIGRPRPFQVELYRGARGGVCRFVHAVTRRLGLRELVPLEYGFFVKALLKDFDVLHFHDSFTAFSPLTMALASRHRPVFFTAHDCLHFTGGCLYPMKCTGHLTRCGRCPQRKRIGWFDFTPWTQRLNRWIARTFPIRYVYPSRWLREEAGRALHFRLPPVVIPNGFDPAPYRFRSRADARRTLDLPPEKKIICFSAADVADERKGAAYALEAVMAVRDLDPLVVLVGRPMPDLEKMLGGIPFRAFGYIENREDLGLVYAAADAVLFCSLQENLPITVQEAMAAATPVVGFAVGGVPELVQDGVSAWLVSTGDQAGLNEALRRALLSGALEQRGTAARDFLEKNFSPAGWVQAHTALYRPGADQTDGSSGTA
jgi:glycosyltransferase involved in cell wall biosynthesis